MVVDDEDDDDDRGIRPSKVHIVAFVLNNSNLVL